jgi:hypothetical protein
MTGKRTLTVGLVGYKFMGKPIQMPGGNRRDCLISRRIFV